MTEQNAYTPRLRIAEDIVDDLIQAVIDRENANHWDNRRRVVQMRHKVIAALAAAPRGYYTAPQIDQMARDAREPSEEVVERVEAAIRAAWEAERDVPFPLYDSEAEALARAAIAAMQSAFTSTQRGE